MSNYYGKLLELKGIENRDNKFFLKVKFSFKETIEIFLEIDEYTAKNLEKMVQFDEIYKYRLTFKTFKDDSQNQNIAVLTKTYREKSLIIHFLCSQDYIDKLAAIKNLEDIKDVDKLSFISIKSLSINIDPENNNINNTSKKSILRFSSVSTAIISIVVVLIFGYLGQLYLNQTYFNEKVLAESIDSDINQYKEILTEPILYNYINEEISQTIEYENEIIDDNLSIQDNIAFIELDDTITYNLPEGKVALTFDDGPSQYTKEIIDILKEYNVGGTFFLTGYNVEKYPEHVRYIQSNGYSIGSHSLSHFNMSKISYEKQKRELIESMEMLKDITDENILLFRPPYGSYNRQLVNLVVENQYKIILWNNDPEDWKTRDADKIFESIQNSITSGAIILLHESQAVIDSLPKIIEYLQDQNLEIVNLK